MSKYTHFTLTVEPKSLTAGFSAGDGESLIEELRDESDGADWCLGEDAESGRWYEHEDELLAFSARKPGWVFTLKGQGEDAGDVWVKYFCEGRIQHAPAKFDAFDETKLTSGSRKPKF